MLQYWHLPNLVGINRNPHESGLGSQVWAQCAYYFDVCRLCQDGPTTRHRVLNLDLTQANIPGAYGLTVDLTDAGQVFSALSRLCRDDGI